MKLTQKLMSLILMISTCLLIYPVTGNGFIRKNNSRERERRQGYSEVESRQNQTSISSTFYQQPLKPEIPTLYSIPESTQVLLRSNEPQGEQNEKFNPENIQPETSTEDTSLQEQSQPHKSHGSEDEETSEDIEIPTTTQTSVGDIGSKNFEKVIPDEPIHQDNEENPKNTHIPFFGGYSRSNFPDEESNLRENLNNFNKNSNNNFINGNYIPISRNEIPNEPYSSPRPIDQQQVENLFYQNQREAARAQEMKGEQVVPFEQFEVLHQPTRNEYNQGQMRTYISKEQQQLPKFYQQKPHPIESLRRTESMSTNLVGNIQEMNLEGLGSDIVDAKLLERVQQIIENHEREQRVYLQQYQQQFPTITNQNKNIGPLSNNERDRSHSQQSSFYDRSITVTNPQKINQEQQIQSSGYYSPLNLNLFRETKTFPENPNLEFQPAILTGHFVESYGKKNQGSRSSPAPYLPANHNSSPHLTQQSINLGNNGQGRIIPQNYYSKQQYSTPIGTDQPDQQYPQPQPQPQQYPNQEQRQIATDQYRDSHQQQYNVMLPESEEVKNVQVNQPNNIQVLSETGIQSPFQERLQEDRFKPTIMNPLQGYENRREETRSLFPAKPNGKSPNDIGVKPYEQNSYGQHLTRDESKEMDNFLENFRGSQPKPSILAEKQEFDYLPPGIHGREETVGGPNQYQHNQVELHSLRSTQNLNIENPNVITRTIVIHEQPTSEENPEGLTNRAVIMNHDYNNGSKFPPPFFNNYVPKSMSNEIDNPILPNQSEQQFKFLSASAKLTVAEEPVKSLLTPSNNFYNHPSELSLNLNQNSEKLEEADIGNPKAIYGIPIAPVLGPDSLDDVIVVDAARSSNSIQPNYLTPNDPDQNYRYVLPSRSAGDRAVQDPSSLTQNSNLFAVYRLPNSEGSRVAESVKPQIFELHQPIISSPNDSGPFTQSQQQRQDEEIRSNQYGPSGILTKRNIYKRFSSAIVAPLAGSFTIKHMNFS